MQAELTEQILKYVDQHDSIDTLDLVEILREDHQKIVGAVKSIAANGDLLNTEQTSRKTWELSEEGKLVAENGSHEAIVYYSVPAGGISQTELMKVSFPCNQLVSSYSSFNFLRAHQMQKSDLVKPWLMAGSLWTSLVKHP